MKAINHKILFILLCLIPTISAGEFKANSFKTSLFKYSITSLEKKLFQDIKDGQLDHFTLIEAALIASGVRDSMSLRRYTNKIDKIVKKISNQKKFNSLTPYQKSEAILVYLHRAVLKSYSLNATQLDVALDTGRFNCVSSAVLYNFFSNRFGIKTKAVLVPDHVFSISFFKNKFVDVETTTMYGFDPDGKNRDRKEFQKLTGFKRYGKNKTKSRKTLSNIQLIAAIYSNRSAFSQKDFNYPVGITNSVKALVFYPNFKESLGNLKANYVNWGAYLNRKKKFDFSLKVIKEGLTFFPNDSLLLRASKSIYHNYALHLSQEKKFKKSLTLIRAAKKAFPNDQERVKLLLVLYNHFWRYKMVQKEFKSALELIEKGERDIGSHKTLTQMEIDTYKKWSYHHFNKNDFNLSLKVLNEGIKKFQNNRELSNIIHITYLAMGESYIKRGKFIVGKGFFDNYLAQNPNDSKMKKLYVHFFLFYTQKSVKEKQLDKAIEQALTGYKNFPQNKKIKQNLHYAYFSKVKEMIHLSQLAEGKKIIHQLIQKLRDHNKNKAIWKTFYILIYEDFLKLKKIEKGIYYFTSPWLNDRHNRTILSMILNNLVHKQLLSHSKVGKWKDGWNKLLKIEAKTKNKNLFADLKKNYLLRWLVFLDKKNDFKKGVDISKLGVKLFPNDSNFKIYLKFFKKRLTHR